MSQLSPAFCRSGGGGGGFFEGIMGGWSASAWLNNSSSDEDGEADNGESIGESKGFPLCGTDRLRSGEAATTPFGWSTNDDQFIRPISQEKQ
jgi:hypothetical protein